MANNKSVEDTYSKMSQREHIYKIPDTYMGSVKSQLMDMWVYDNGKIIKKNILFNPGFFKIIDEILMNARDRFYVDGETCKTINIAISDNIFDIYNDGNGIPIEIHKKYNVYVPQLVFTELLTSSNYNENEIRFTGGKNGYGAKLTNIFSTSFSVEVVNNNKKFTINCFKNMEIIDNPII